MVIDIFCFPNKIEMTSSVVSTNFVGIIIFKLNSLEFFFLRILL